MSRGIADFRPPQVFGPAQAAGSSGEQRPASSVAPGAEIPKAKERVSDQERIEAAGRPADAPPAGRLRRWTSHAVRSLPSALVLAILGALGVYGHYSGWTLPKLSALAGAAERAEDDWCEEHSVPESRCVECHPQLLPPEEEFGWCKAHGIPNCPLEHPEVAQLKTPVKMTEADRQRAAWALAIAPRPENNPICKNYRRRVQFASLEAMRKAGVDVAVAERHPIVESLSVHAEVRYDQTRLASVASRLAGTVWRVEKSVGDAVAAGQLLAVVDAPEVGRAKAELLQALAQTELARHALERIRRLAAQGITPGRQLQTAQAESLQARARLLSAQQTLANLGLPASLEALEVLSEPERLERVARLGFADAEWQRFAPARPPATLLPLRSPGDGVIVARQVVAGELVDTSRVLFQVADIRRMWLMLNVPIEEAPRLVLGQRVRYRPEGIAGWLEGSLAWISTTADPQTRMVLARAELPNPEGRVRNGTFGKAEIILREEAEAVVVPAQAIQWEGCCHVVFVRDRGFFDAPEAPKVFHVRPVRVGVRNGPLAEVVAGLLPGEVVAAQGSEVLRGELLKNALGEGCAGCQ